MTVSQVVPYSTGNSVCLVIQDANKAEHLIINSDL